MIIQGGKRIVIASAVLLVLASCESGYADFTGTVGLTSNFGDWLPGDPPVPVPPGALLTITVTGNQNENTGGLSTIQLNWSNSTPGQDLANAPWSWSGDADSINPFLVDDDDLLDSIVTRKGTGAGIEGASFAIGTLSFNAPMVEDIYTLDLNGGTLQGGSPTATYLADGVNFLLPGTNLDLDSFVYVTPEPGSMLLFAVGGLALLRHRRKAA